VGARATRRLPAATFDVPHIPLGLCCSMALAWLGYAAPRLTPAGIVVMWPAGSPVLDRARSADVG